MRLNYCEDPHNSYYQNGPQIANYVRYKNLYPKVRIMSPVTIIHHSKQNLKMVYFLEPYDKSTMSLNKDDEKIIGNH